jgi:hypothetical protein
VPKSWLVSRNNCVNEFAKDGEANAAHHAKATAAILMGRSPRTVGNDNKNRDQLTSKQTLQDLIFGAKTQQVWNYRQIGGDGIQVSDSLERPDVRFHPQPGISVRNPKSVAKIQVVLCLLAQVAS